MPQKPRTHLQSAERAAERAAAASATASAAHANRAAAVALATTDALAAAKHATADTQSDAAQSKADDAYWATVGIAARADQEFKYAGVLAQIAALRLQQAIGGDVEGDLVCDLHDLNVQADELDPASEIASWNAHLEARIEEVGDSVKEADTKALKRRGPGTIPFGLTAREEAAAHLQWLANAHWATEPAQQAERLHRAIVDYGGASTLAPAAGRRPPAPQSVSQKQSVPVWSLENLNEACPICQEELGTTGDVVQLQCPQPPGANESAPHLFHLTCITHYAEVWGKRGFPGTPGTQASCPTCRVPMTHCRSVRRHGKAPTAHSRGRGWGFFDSTPPPLPLRSAEFSLVVLLLGGQVHMFGHR